MSDEEVWDDDSRDALRNTLLSFIRGEVRLRKQSHDGILEECRAGYIEEECPESEWDTFLRLAAAELEQAAEKHAAEQVDWPSVTDCDRLDRAEAALRERDIMLWQVSPCCGAELPERIDEVERRHPGFRERVRGYAFFIDQNMPESLAESRQVLVYLAYGWFSPDASDVDEAVYEHHALGVGREVADCLREHGLKVDWDGDFSRKIGLSLNWQRRELLE